MAANIISELDSQLASLNQLKPPGASKVKISSITQLCLNNIQSESTIVQSLYRALKKAPATHKLGALYVIDSVVRQWIEKAKQLGQPLNFEGRGQPGTYFAAVKRVTELMPALLDDIVKGLPAEQKPKLENMIGIWEKGSTFPATLLVDFREKTSSQTVPNGTSEPQQQQVAELSGGKFMAPIPSKPVLTPTGFPPPHLHEQGFIARRGEQTQMNGHSRPSTSQQAQTQPQQRPPAPQYVPQPQHQQEVQPGPSATASATDVSSILAALANAAPKSAVAPTPAPAPFQVQPSPPSHASTMAQLPPELAALFSQQSGQNGLHALLPPPPQPQQSVYNAPPMPMQMSNYQPQPQGYQGFPQYAGYPPQPPPSIPQGYAVAPPPPQPVSPNDVLGPLRSILPNNILNDPKKLVEALNLLQDLQKQGLSMEQWGPILQAFDQSLPPTQASHAENVGQDRYRGRARSRSPERAGRRRASPVYGSYDEIKQDGDDRGYDDRANRRNGSGGRPRYRQRSPIGIRGSPSDGAMNGGPMQPKFIGYDASLPANHIKVLSRTLFVGGANGTQAEIEELFGRFGRVQTCISNQAKRHAFVKMTTREAALAARQGMDDLQQRNDREVMNVARQTKWGVGFGPRECCDYQKGESTIPIYKLTDADVKWLLTAEYGGTGGKAPEGGMVVEEPDIEIGAGVSSKAMSKRVLPDTGPPAGNKRSKEDKKRARHAHNDRDRDRESGGYSGYNGGGGASAPQHIEHYSHLRPEPVAVATPPAVPTFGFSLPQMDGSQGGYR